MSDDWGTYRRGLDDEDEQDEKDEKDDGELDRETPGGWVEEERASGHSRSHWPEDDEPAPEEEPPTGWPTPGPTWQRPEYGDSPPEWQRSGEPVPGYYGEHREDLFADAAAERYDPRHSRDPLARLFPGLPRGVRVTLDWILTIAGAILIVLALKQWVVNPYRIPSSSMEPTLNCAKGPGSPGCLGNSSDRVLACRICLDFGSPSRDDIVVFNTPSEAALKCGEGGTFVKRVIGLPGETVHEDEKGFISVKKPGAPEFVQLKEPYLPAQNRLADSQHFGQTWTVPPDNYFMMGDNRAQSCDSRTWGAVPRNKLIGIVFFVYWPPDRISFK
jgi:signal peptidase I